ncbi:NIF3-like protein-like protein [Schizopora paradoxa]|uniref:NIF3-like protein-like protein n=1 Tax=Schizopora paradoxa TaxID=27342 RepID=A0A0H2S2X0_9AGAM|nr:NIF3-like protein-like protein [Schizopora paradoxa]
MSLVKSVCTAMERIAPLRLAESWDNVGLLLEASSDGLSGRKQAGSKVMLTIDLTPPVLQEALRKDVNMIVSYHAPIFRPLRALTLSNPLQATLLRCAQAGISIYTPHTSLDATEGGINDWLASLFPNSSSSSEKKNLVTPIVEKDGNPNVGAGRIVRIGKPGISFSECVRSVKEGLGVAHVEVAEPYDIREDTLIESIAICAGSGSSVLANVDADLYFTGEMAHHDVLASVADGRRVILCGHTNTERGYLKHLAPRLLSELKAEEGGRDTTVIVSEEDRHPLRLA